MPQLSGQLSFMPCRDLLLYLGNRKLSGRLELRRAGLRKIIAIDDGAATSAASNDPREYLGQVLINAGHLSEEDFDRAYQTQKETEVPLGKILTMIGLVPEDVVRLALQSKIRETALDVCNWQEGEFTFEQGDPAVAGVLVPVPLFDVCREAESRTALWVKIREAFPSGRLRLSLVSGAAVPTYAPTSIEGRLLPLIRDGRSIDEMLLHLHSTEFALYQRLHSMLVQGIVEVARAHGGATEPEAADPEDWFPAEAPGGAVTEGDALAAARSALSGGNPAEAERLASKAVAERPTEEGQRILEEAEAALLARLRRELLEQPRVPVVKVDRNRIRAMPLAPPARYLLARMDGTRDLGAIIRVSPLRELDALKLVRRLLADDLVTLR